MGKYVKLGFILPVLTCCIGCQKFDAFLQEMEAKEEARKKAEYEKEMAEYNKHVKRIKAGLIPGVTYNEPRRLTRAEAAEQRLRHLEEDYEYYQRRKALLMRY